MRCPFLREATVRYCRAAPLKKMIVHRPGQASVERCSSPDYVRCPVARQQLPHHNGDSRCPFLHECLVQYCAAASVTKYIPYSESALSRCGTDSHHYCDLYLAVASGSGDAEPRDAGSDDRPSSDSVDGLPLPRALWYTHNHLWLDISADGMIHLGVDAFLSAFLGGVQKIDFVEARGLCHPTAVLSVRDVALRLVFPNLVDVLRPNGSLKTAPEKAAVHPYGSGWLFEGTRRRLSAEEPSPPETASLLSGTRAHAWMKQELRRFAEFLQTHDSASDCQPVLADGGFPRRAQCAQLSAPTLLRLFNAFFRLP